MDGSGIIEHVKGRRGILVAALGLGLVPVLVLVLWPREREPEYQGKKLSEWLFAYAHHTDHEAANAVKHIGTNALPFLIKWIGYQPPKWRTRFAHVIEDTPLPLPRKRVDRMIASRQARAALAVYGFQILRDQTASAVPELTQMLADLSSQERVESVMLALKYTGRKGLEALLAVVKNKAASTRCRDRAISNIADPVMDLGTNAIWAARALIPCLDDPAIAFHVAVALAVLRVDPEIIVPVLAKCLRSPDTSAREGAARALGILGSKAVSAAPALFEATRDEDEKVRLEANNALARIAPQVLTNAAH